MSRYVLTVVYRDGVPQEVRRYFSLRAALEERDGSEAKTSRHSSTWMVWDSEDAERGYADWMACGVHGGFGVEIAEACAECEGVGA